MNVGRLSFRSSTSIRSMRTVCLGGCPLSVAATDSRYMDFSSWSSDTLVLITPVMRSMKNSPFPSESRPVRGKRSLRYTVVVRNEIVADKRACFSRVLRRYRKIRAFIGDRNYFIIVLSTIKQLKFQFAMETTSCVVNSRRVSSESGAAREPDNCEMREKNDSLNFGKILERLV